MDPNGTRPCDVRDRASAYCPGDQEQDTRMTNRVVNTVGYGVVEPVSGPVVVATDGSADLKAVGGGYLSTTGHYGYRAHQYPDDISGQQRALIAELRSVMWALEVVVPVHTGPIEVRCDSLAAIDYLKSWRRGDVRMPSGYQGTWRYSGSTPLLLQLQELVARTPTLKFRHEKGHVGNALNETADSLAKLALRATKRQIEKPAARRVAEMWAARGLEDWKRQRG